MRYFEDFPVGYTETFGSKTVVQDEIIAFAHEFDPQYFHTDPVAAEHSMFRGLVASGWHTVSMTCRMFTDHGLKDVLNLGGIGADDLLWMKAVRPGDTLYVKMTIVDARRSRSKPDRGAVRIRLDTYNQADECVVTATVTTLVGVRPTADS